MDMEGENTKRELNAVILKLSLFVCESTDKSIWPSMGFDKNGLVELIHQPA